MQILSNKNYVHKKHIIQEKLGQITKSYPTFDKKVFDKNWYIAKICSTN